MTTCADHGYDTNFIVTDNQVPRAVNNFRSHPSIIMIKNKKKKWPKPFFWSSNFWRCIGKGCRSVCVGRYVPVGSGVAVVDRVFGTSSGFMSNSAMRWTPWPCILSLKSFDNTWSKSYIPCLLLIKMLRFTCGEKKICQTSKMSQNIMTMIVVDVTLVYK